MNVNNNNDGRFVYRFQFGGDNLMDPFNVSDELDDLMLQDNLMEGGLVNNEATQIQREIQMLRRQNQIAEYKIKNKAFLSCIRIGLLYFCYYLSDYKLTDYTRNLVIYLLIFEALLISNYITMKLYLTILKIFSPNSISFPTLCIYVDLAAVLIFFSWFLYSVYEIFYNSNELSEGFSQNPYMMYYLIMLMLYGFFTFSGIIFFSLFFICLCPCISYTAIRTRINEYREEKKRKKLVEDLVGIKFEDYKKTSKDKFQSSCVICTDDFKDKDIVIMLKCNRMHTMHQDCIKQWLQKNAICPICRTNLMH